MRSQETETLTVSIVAPMKSGVRVSPAPRRVDTTTNMTAPAGTEHITMRTNGVAAVTTAGSTRNAAIRAGAQTKTGSAGSNESATAARIDWRTVSSAAV